MLRSATSDFSRCVSSFSTSVSRDFQIGFPANQELIPPAGQRGGGHPQLARKRFDILAA
jgi:hypothetical protein